MLISFSTKICYLILLRMTLLSRFLGEITVHSPPPNPANFNNRKITLFVVTIFMKNCEKILAFITYSEEGTSLSVYRNVTMYVVLICGNKSQNFFAISTASFLTSHYNRLLSRAYCYSSCAQTFSKIRSSFSLSLIHI